MLNNVKELLVDQQLQKHEVKVSILISQKHKLMIALEIKIVF